MEDRLPLTTLDQARSWPGDYEEGIEVVPSQAGLEVDCVNDGLELASLERNNSQSAKQTATGGEEKEIVGADFSSKTRFIETNEAPKEMKIWGLKRRRFWICFSVVTGIIAIVVLATALGVTLSAQSHSGSEGSSSVPSSAASTTSLHAPASSITSSTTIAPLPSGTFATSLDTLHSNKSCLANLESYNAWACNITTIELSITDDKVAILGSGDATNPGYGLQPITNVRTTVMEVVDKQNVDRGIAYYFQTYYDAVVLVQDLPFTLTRRKKRDDVLQAGDKLWACHFNQTLLQAFFYLSVLQDASADSTDTLPGYPNLIRVRLSRITGGPSPYCEEVRVLDDGTYTIVANNAGNTVSHTLTESIPSTNATNRGCMCDWNNNS